jgi:hypothetical protein
MEDVASVKTDDGRLLLTSLLARKKKSKARISEIDSGEPAGTGAGRKPGLA